MTFHRQIATNRLAWALVFLLCLSASGCAPPPGAQALSTGPQDDATRRQGTVKVASTGACDAATGAWSDDRAPALSDDSFTISIPPRHKPTQIAWPKEKPDPQTSFAVPDRRVLPGIAVTDHPVLSGAAHKVSGKRDVLIFVHGYSHSFAKSLFRLAQIAADRDLTETPILFAWPSSASVTGSVEAKDAVTCSPDDLAKLLADVAGDPSVGNITLLGHRRGGWLVAHALRQLCLSGQDKVIDRLGNPPMSLHVLPDHRALKLSEWLAGARRRVGLIGACPLFGLVFDHDPFLAGDHRL